jgi:hypothetical protein
MARTNAGANWQAKIMGSPTNPGTGTFASASYMALTANSSAPSATDATLSGELRGTLARTRVGFSHTSTTTSYTLHATFTSTTSVKIFKLGIFTASSGGTMFLETLLNDPVTMVSGDQCLVTATVNI